MTEDYYESKQLAKCFITKLSSQVKIPQEMIDTLKINGDNLVAIVPGESKKMTFFVTKAKQVLFVRLFLDKDSLDDNFFTSLRDKLKQLGMQNLFSTGLCFKQDMCVWEGVFEYDNDANFDQIQLKLKEVIHVKSTKFEKIHIT
jgi:hypothetical protein